MHSTFKRTLRPVVWTAGALLSALPTGMATTLLGRRLGRRTFRALGISGFSSTARRLLLHRLSMPPPGAEFDGIILIAGAPRIGKSTVALAVADKLRMHVFSTDDIELLCRDLPKEDQKAAQERLLSQICRQSRGLVLEGKELLKIFNHDANSNAAWFQNFPDLRPDGKVHTFAVGCYTSSAESWEAALRVHGGWVAERGDEYLLHFANARSKWNRRIREMALAAGVEYFEIPREDFAAAVSRTVDAIVARVRG